MLRQRRIALPPPDDHIGYLEAARFQSVANDVLCRVVGVPADHTDVDRLAMLRGLLVSPSPEGLIDRVHTMVRRGASAVDLLDHYLPKLARDLGQDWVDDRVSFTTVTMGCLRLASLVPVLERLSPPPKIVDPASQSRILLTLVSGGQHSLGLCVLAAQLRRNGLDPQVDFNGAVPSDDPFDLILVSASGQETLTTLRSTIENYRVSHPGAAIVLGGGAVYLRPDICRQSGADHVTCDVERILALCLRSPKRENPHFLRPVQ